MNELLEKEEKYNLWDFKISSLHLWPLIRSSIFLKYEMNKKAYAEPHYIINKYNIVLPKLWKHHLKTIYLLNIRRDCFDVLFFSTASARYFNKENKFYENRLYGRYFESFSKPLNFESSYRGFFPNILANNENTYEYYTLIMLAELYAKINKYSVYNMKDKTDIKLFSKTISTIFKNCVSNNYIETVITNSLAKLPNEKRLYFDKILPRIKNKIAFVHCASYLGRITAILTKILHSAGFKVIEVQHGSVSKEHYAYNYPQSCIENKNHQCREYLPDYLLMFGKYWADKIHTPSRKIVVGYPYLNEISNKLIREITPENKTMLIVSQGTVTKHMVNIAKKLSQTFRDYHIIFKLHPGEIPFKERYSSLKSYSNIEIIGNYNIYELIAKSSILVGYNSTTLFEALKFPEKRIFILENSDVPDEIGYKFCNIEELIDAIRDNTKGYPKVNSEYFWASNWEEKFTNFKRNHLGMKI